MEKSKVYFTDFRTRLGEGLPSKLKRLMKAAGIQDMDMDHKFVAIKMHFGELGNLGFLRPNYAKAVADVVKELAKDHRLIVTMEENVRSGGYGEKVRDYVQEQEIPVHVLTIALPDEYVEHGNVALLYEEVGIDAESVTKRIIEKYVTCPKEDGRR